MSGPVIDAAGIATWRVTGYAEVIPVDPTAPLLPACRPSGSNRIAAQVPSILAGRHLVANLVEKIQDEVDLVDRFGLAGDRILQYGGILQYDEALAIGVHVKV